MQQGESWQVPRDRVLKVRFGRTKVFEIVGRCLNQNEAGVVLEASSETDAYAGFAPVRQFVPYGSLIEIEVLGEQSAALELERQSRDVQRTSRVQDELAGILGQAASREAEDEDVEAASPAPEAEISAAEKLRRRQQPHASEDEAGAGE